MIHLINEQYRATCEAMTQSLRGYTGVKNDYVDNISILHQLYDDIPEYVEGISGLRIANEKLLFKLNNKNCYIKYNDFTSKLMIVVNSASTEIWDASHEYGAYLDAVVKYLNDEL